MPQRISLLLKKPILNVEYFSLRQAKTPWPVLPTPSTRPAPRRRRLPVSAPRGMRLVPPAGSAKREAHVNPSPQSGLFADRTFGCADHCRCGAYAGGAQFFRLDTKSASAHQHRSHSQRPAIGSRASHPLKCQRRDRKLPRRPFRSRST